MKQALRDQVHECITIQDLDFNCISYRDVEILFDLFGLFKVACKEAKCTVIFFGPFAFFKHTKTIRGLTHK